MGHTFLAKPAALPMFFCLRSDSETIRLVLALCGRLHLSMQQPPSQQKAGLNHPLEEQACFSIYTSLAFNSETQQNDSFYFCFVLGSKAPKAQKIANASGVSKLQIQCSLAIISFCSEHGQLQRWDECSPSKSFKTCV